MRCSADFSGWQEPRRAGTTPGMLISRTPNRLTNFQTRVDPAEDSGNRKLQTRGERWRTGNQRTVRYVDDNPKALRMLKFVIEGSGYKVATARDAGEALERMQQSGCDLVLVNYRMLKMIGSDPILAIKRFSPGTPIILISGHALLPPQEFSHVDAHVGKGATLDVLLDKIRALVVAHESKPRRCKRLTRKAK